MNTTELQQKLAEALGINILEDNFYIAAARLNEVVHEALNLKTKSELPATKKQLVFAKDIGLNIDGLDRHTASSKISARLDILNELALRNLDLKPCDTVFLRGKPKKQEIVSCVGKNRLIYLKRWGGQTVYPTQILKKKK